MNERFVIPKEFTVWKEVQKWYQQQLLEKTLWREIVALPLLNIRGHPLKGAPAQLAKSTFPFEKGALSELHL